MYAHNDALQFSDKLTKLLGSHGLKFGVTVDRGQKQQNFQNLETGQLWFGTDNSEGTGNSGADMLVGPDRRSSPRARHAPATRRPAALRRVPLLEHRRLRAGQLEAALEPDARVRRPLRLLDEQPGAERPRRLLRSRRCTTRPRARSSIPARSSASTASATSTPAARRPASSGNREPFALPRVNVAWNIDGEGNNVLRGGYGMFYNRNMGNVEYDNTLRLAPNAYQVGTDFWAGGNYGNGLGLTYDTVHEATLANRIGSLGDQHADARLVHVPDDAQLQPVVRAADSVEPGGRGQPTSAPAAATWSAAATATSCRSACSTRAPSTASTCRTRSTATRSPARSTNLATFRPYNAQWHNAGCGG